MRQARTRKLMFGVVMAVFSLGSASQLHAERIFFANGRTMAVKGYRVEGDMVTVTLQHGGEATFNRTLIAGIAEDEVPAAAEMVVATPPGLFSAPRSAVLEPLESRPFASLIEDVALKHGVDPALVHAVIKNESNYQPRATSHVGARGLMQLMPATGRDLGVRTVRELYDPETNVEAGVQYLKFLLARFDLTDAVAAYNAGPGNVRKYNGIPPFKETQTYVRKVLGDYLRH